MSDLEAVYEELKKLNEKVDGIIEHRVRETLSLRELSALLGRQESTVYYQLTNTEDVEPEKHYWKHKGKLRIHPGVANILREEYGDGRW